MISKGYPRKKRGGDRGNLSKVSIKGNAISSEVRGRQSDQYAAALAPILQRLGTSHTSLREIAAELTRLGISPPRGGLEWHANQVKRLIARCEKIVGEHLLAKNPSIIQRADATTEYE